MKTAIEKNVQAFSTLFGDPALANYLRDRRIGVFFGDNSDTVSGRLLTEALADTLARLWPRIDSSGPLADLFLSTARKTAQSGQLPIDLNDRWAPPYDSVVVIGSGTVRDAGPIVWIGADGWKVSFGTNSRLGDSPLPIGPAAAAAIAAAEVFKQVFESKLESHGITPLGDGEWNLWNLGIDGSLPGEQNIVFPRTHVFGCGAVTHGLLWVLERWPTPVSGTILLIDHDVYDYTNGQRYVGMRPEDPSRIKVDALAERLQSSHPALKVLPFQQSMNDYFDFHEPIPSVTLAIVGLDSEESRRQAALKLPRRSINMWTDGHHLGSSRHGFRDGWPCLFCSYPEDISRQKDEVAIISSQTGLQPYRVRTLLDTGESLTPSDASLVVSKLGRPANEVTGKSLRTILQQLCATGHVKLSGKVGDTDVPFAFSSLLAGVVGFRNIVKELQSPSDPPTRWTYDILQRPNPGLVQPASPRDNCYLCSVKETTITNK